MPLDFKNMTDEQVKAIALDPNTPREDWLAAFDEGLNRVTMKLKQKHADDCDCVNCQGLQDG